MFKKMKLRTRLLLSICFISVLSFAITIGIIATKAKRISQEGALITADEIAYRYGNLVKAQLESGFTAAEILAESFEGIAKEDGVPLRKLMNEMLVRVLEKNPGFIGVWTVWEPNALDGLDGKYSNTKGHDATGRFIPYWNRGSGTIQVEPLVDYTTSGVGDYYLVPLKTRKKLVTEPYSYQVGGKDIMLTSLAVPIIIDNKVVGVVGVDLSLESFEGLINSIKVFGTGYGALTSNTGIIVGHPNKDLVGKNIGDLLNRDATIAIQDGEPFTITQKSVQTKTVSYIHNVPIQVSTTETPWAFLIIAPLDEVTKGAEEIISSAILVSVIAMLIFVVIIFFLANSIVSPIKSIGEGLEDIAQGEGDLTSRLQVDREDEIGELAHWFNVFVEKLQVMIGQIQSNLNTLNTSVEQLTSVSGNLSEGADDASEKSNTVAAAANQMSANMEAVAHASEEAATNVNMIASATEEMSATVNEIAGNTSKARQVSEQAVEKTTSASNRMDELGGAALEISKVTETITEISEQTNLLALNATIEAARAGEAGKGFAVVANEIKELAKQTSEATLEIRQKIEAIQQSTDLSVKEMGDINVVINDVNEIVNTIATAVEEQSASTGEISNNVSNAAQGIAEVNENVSQSSTVSEEISEQISGVSQVSGVIQGDSNKVNNQAGELSALSRQLEDIVGQFKL